MARPHAASLLLCVLPLTFAVKGAYADSINLPIPEAPTTIFSTKLGSADVDLTLVGSWTAGISFGTGLLFAPGVPVQLLDSFPSLDTGFVFTQTPDITVSLELMKRFFLSATIIGSFANNYIQMGYRGGPNEALRYVILGTQGITIPASALMQIPNQPQGSLGAMAEFTAGGSTNDLLLRWDATLPKTKTFVGKNELVEQVLEINQYIKGMYFFLPDTGLDPSTLQVFIEDPNGTYFSAVDGRKYRLATTNDVVLDPVNGLVSLVNAVKGRILVFYRKRGNPVGTTTTGTLPKDNAGNPPRDPGNSQPFNWLLNQSYPQYMGLDMTHRRITLSGVGGTCLLLWEPGDNSPFEIDSSYAFSANPPADVSKINIKLNPKNASASLPSNVSFQSDPPHKRFSVLQNVQNIRATFYNFYPFADPTGLIYGPDRDSVTGGLPYNIYVQMLSPTNQMVLESNIEPGSVQVTVNGIAETRFSVEPVSGTLTPQFDILPTDRIEVTYRKAEQGVSGGDILFAWEDKIPLSDQTQLSFSTGVRWNANPWTYSQVPYSKSGTVIATAGINGKTDRLDYSAEAGVSYTNPDTTGILRLFGMEGNSVQVDLSEDDAYPASVPDNSEIPALLQSNRGQLFYRDYRTYGALGSSSLQTIEAPAPAQMPYANGYRMGPYNVTGSDGNLNPVSLVFEYSLTATNTWVGAQIPVSSGSFVDLSNARAISVRLRWNTGPLPTNGSVNVYLQVGSVSEDLDGSGVLKAEVAPTDPGFPFVDSGNGGIVLRVGAGPKLTGNGKLDTEDADGNLVLDLEDPSRVVSEGPVDSGSLSSSWKNFTFPLLDADRQKLLQSRSVRIIIVTQGGNAAGEILVDSVTVEATPFWPQMQGSDSKANVGIQEITEIQAQDPPSGGDFASRFPDTYNRFHPNGEPNQVLETKWQSISNTFTIQGYIPQGTSDSPQGTGGIQYETVVSYVRSSLAGNYKFLLLDRSSKGIVWNVPIPGDNTWHEVKVSRTGNSVRVDGSDTGPPLQFDSSYGSLEQFQVVVPSSAAAEYFYIDEVYLTDPKGVFGAALVGHINANFPGRILSAGQIPILANVALRQEVALYSAGFAPLYGVPYPAEDLSSRSHVDADLVYARTSLDLDLRDQGGSMSASGGHRVTVPNVSSPVTVTDAFSLSTTGGFTRENALALTAGSAAALTFDSTANASPDETDTSGLLTQTWLTGLTLTPFPPFGISSTLSLSQALTGYTLAQEWYGARWARETGLLLPWQGGGDVTRSEKLGFKAGIPAAPFGVSFEATGGNNRFADAQSPTGFSQENDSSLGLSFALKLGAGDSADSIGLSYKRALSITNPAFPGPRFQEEASEWSDLMYQQAYMLLGIPVGEIFSDNTGILPEWQSASTGTYSPTLGISYQRSYGSRLTDLFIPSTVDLSVGQNLQGTYGVPETSIFVRPKITTRAVNLFGQLGSNPRLRNVLTDEYSLSVSASVDKSTPTLYPQYGNGPILSALSVQAYATFTGQNGNQLTLVETLRRDQISTIVFSNDSQAAYEWRVLPKAGIPLPLLPVDIGATGHFEHRESAEITVGYQDSGTFHPFTLLLGHATSLVYPGHGSIKASLNLGMDVEDLLSVGFAWRFAIRAAIEAKLTF